tara:strand:- start:1397 stop:2059 length:663 start_codon:yes stop_codon:yes gene_type:complete
MKRKIKILKAKGGADAATESFGKSAGFTGQSRADPKGGFDLSGGKGPTFNNAPATTGGSGSKTTNQVSTSTSNNKGTGSKISFMPITMQIAKSLVIDPLTTYSRTQKVKGENFFGKPKDLPASRDFYRATGKPIDVMSKTGVNYMKDAGLIKPTRTVKPPSQIGGNKQQLCPDGTYPPCKLPTTQIKTPVKKPNTFLSGFQAYDDGGEVVISSNVDKSLL